MDPDMSDSSSERHPVERLAEEFVERQRAGENPCISEYAERYPELAEEIRDLFPALVAVEELKPGTHDRTGPYTVATPDGQRLERLGDYRVLREVGHGGMGVVYEAEQVSLGRHVALKVLPAQALLQPARVERFRREARAAARLHHTNIVPVFGVGEESGLHYDVMQFIAGQGLDQVLNEIRRCRAGGVSDTPISLSASQVAQGLLTGQFTVAEPRAESSGTVPLPAAPVGASATDPGRPYWQSVARVGVQVAEALAYAHGQGILHRDIKPSNILLDTAGMAWVADFGLAKAADSEELTATGDVVGTLRYLAPERLDGKGDGRSDVYSLGLTLYELLTLRPAFSDSDRERLLQRILHDDPPRPKALAPDVPRDLETIVLKAIEKDPDHRYASAAELAEDLRRFLEDRPIRARRVGSVERFGRWCRRNPALAATGTVAALALLTATVVSIVFAVQKDRDAATLREQGRDLQDALALSKKRGEDLQQRGDELAATSRQRLGALRDSTRLAFGHGLSLAEQGDLKRGLLWLAQAGEIASAAGGGVEDLHEYVRLQYAYYRDRLLPLRAAVPLNRMGVLQPTLSPDGATLVVPVKQKQLELWDLSMARVRATLEHDSEVRRLHFSPDGKILLAVAHPATSTEPGSVRRWDLATGASLGEALVVPGDSESVRAVSPDGRTVLIARRLPNLGTAREYQVWDTADNSQRCTLKKRDAAETFRIVEQVGVAQFQFSPNGRILLSKEGLQERGTVRLWDPTSGAGGEAVPHSPGVFQYLFSPDSKYFLTTANPADRTDRTELRLWECIPKGEPGGGFVAIPVGEPWTISGRSPHLWFSPDSRTLLTVPYAGLASRDEGYLRDVPGLGLRATLTHPGQIGFASFSADGAAVLTGSGSEVRIWESATGNPIGPGLIHAQPVRAAVFGPERRTVLTAAGTEARLWDVVTGKPFCEPLPHLHSLSSIHIGAGGRALVTISHDRFDPEFRLWEAIPKPDGRPLRGSAGLHALGFTADSGQVLLSGVKGTRAYDVPSGQPVGKPLPGEIHSKTYSQQRFVTVQDGQARLELRSAETGELIGKPIPRPAGQLGPMLFSPDSKVLLLSHLVAPLRPSEVRLYDTATGQALGEPLPTTMFPVPESIRLGNRVLLLKSQLPNLNLARASLWDARSGRSLDVTLGDFPANSALALSPDQTIAATVGFQGTILWDVATGEELLRLLAVQGRSSLFSPDGRRLLIRVNQEAQVWEVDSGKQLSVLPLPDQVRRFVFSPDGSSVAVDCYHQGEVRSWDVLTGKRLDSGAGPRNQRPEPAVLDADGRTKLVLATEEKLQLWNTSSGKPIGSPLSVSTAFAPVASPDGKVVLIQGSDVRLIDSATGQVLGEPLPHPGPITSASFSPDGLRLVTASGTQARLWDVRTSRPIGEPIVQKQPVRALQFRPDGKVFLTIAEQARLWDGLTGKPIGEPLPLPFAWTGYWFSPDSKYLLLQVLHPGPGRVTETTFWEASTGKPIRSGEEELLNFPRLVCFSHVGRRVFLDRPAVPMNPGGRMWDPATAKPVGPFLEHPGLSQAAFSPDGKVLTTFGNGELRRWDSNTGQALGLPLQTDCKSLYFSNQGDVAAGAQPQAQWLLRASATGKDGLTQLTGLESANTVFSADGKMIYASGLGLQSHRFELRLWDSSTGKLLCPPLPCSGKAHPVFREDGRILVASVWDEKAKRYESQLWKFPEGTAIGEPFQHTRGLTTTSFSPDGNRLAVLTGDPNKGPTEAVIRETSTGKATGKPLTLPASVREVSFSADGKSLRAAGYGPAPGERWAKKWDLETGQAEDDPSPPLYYGDFTTPCPDGKSYLVLEGSLIGNGCVQRRENGTGKLLGQFRHESNGNRVANFSPDGTTVVTGVYDHSRKRGEAQLWDALTGQKRGPLLLLPAQFSSLLSGGIGSLIFSPDGKLLLTATEKDQFAKWDVRLWSTSTGEPLTPPLQQEAGYRWARFSPDGKTFVTASGRSGPGKMQLWSIQGERLCDALCEPAVNIYANYSPDGRLLLTRSGLPNNWQYHLWDTEGKELPLPSGLTAATFSSAGHALLIGRDCHLLQLWGLPGAGKEGQEPAPVPPMGEPSLLPSLLVGALYSPDGKLLALNCGDQALLWDVSTGKPVGDPIQAGGKIASLSFTPDGLLQVVCIKPANVIQRWDTATGKALTPPIRPDGEIVAGLSASAGDTVITRSRRQVSRVQDAFTGKPLGTTLALEGWDQKESELSFAVSPDGKRVLTMLRYGPGKAQVVQLWDAGTGQKIGGPLPAAAWIGHVSFSADSTVAWTGSGLGTRRWDAATGKPIDLPLELESEGQVLGFSPDGQTVVLENSNPVTQVIDLHTGKPVGPPMAVGAQGRKRLGTTCTPDGQIVFLTDSEGIRRIDTATGQPIGPPLTPVGTIVCGPDSRTVAVSGGGELRLWDAVTGSAIGQPVKVQGNPLVLFDAQGRRLLVRLNGGAWLMDAATGERIGPDLEHPFPMRGVAFSPDGRVLVTRCSANPGGESFPEAGDVRLWDAAAGKLIGELDHKEPVTVVAFRPDSQVLLTGTRSEARLWSLPAGTFQAKLPVSPVNAALFSADSKFLFTAEGISEWRGGAVRVWDAATGQTVSGPMPHPLPVEGISLSPDGRLLLTRSCNKPRNGPNEYETRLWHVPTARLVGTPRPGMQPALANPFSPDGRFVLLAPGQAGVPIELWPVPARTEPLPRDLKLEAQVLTGLELDPEGTIHVLDPGKWEQVRQRLLEQGPEQPAGP
jgi:WD40 repeat protein/serine/threonine protein kinase